MRSSNRSRDSNNRVLPVVGLCVRSAVMKSTGNLSLNTSLSDLHGKNNTELQDCHMH
jgi:hypothetical protein